MTQNTSASWEEEFLSLINDDSYPTVLYNYEYKTIKNFISKQIAEAKERERKRIYEEIYEYIVSEHEHIEERDDFPYLQSLELEKFLKELLLNTKNQ